MRAYILTISDKGSQRLRQDTAGPEVQRILSEAGYEVLGITIIPDEEDIIIAKLKEHIENKVNLILTVGGTGFSKRDVTPEATLKVVDKLTPGISEYMRLKSLEITDRAMLSRAVSGIKDDTLIINLPGSKKAAKENLESILPTLKHGLEILLALDTDCGEAS